MPMTTTETDHKPLSKVNCFSEDGELKEVIFGRLDDFRLPEYAPIFDFAGPKTVSLLKKEGGKLFSEADPEWYKKAHDSIESVVDFLKGRGIVVHRPSRITSKEDVDRIETRRSDQQASKLHRHQSGRSHHAGRSGTLAQGSRSTSPARQSTCVPLLPRRQDRRLAPLQHMSDLSGRLR